ncbi:thioredoxin domain-containing protein, partial [Patescibacteria group bacterium]|nr:thioredoxin domain-containing protein [Patescibacteria group bacterium]
MIPMAVLVAGVIIAGAVFYSGSGSSNPQIVPVENIAPAPQQAPPPSFGGGSSDNIKAVSSDDHIKGDLNALVKIVEFSDIECPFCKRFHITMQRIMDEYGASG